MKWDRKESKETDAKQAILTPCRSVLWTPRHAANSLLALVPSWWVYVATQSLYCTQVNDSTNCSELGNKCVFFLDILLWCEQPCGSSHSQTCPRTVPDRTGTPCRRTNWTTKQTKNKTTTALKHPVSRDLNSVAVERSLLHKAIIVKWHQRRDVMASPQYAAHQTGSSRIHHDVCMRHSLCLFHFFPPFLSLCPILSNLLEKQ